MLSLLKEEIKAKKRNLEESNVLEGEKRYFKRGDLSTKQAEKYWERCGVRTGGGGRGQGMSSSDGHDSSPTKKTFSADDDDAPELPRAEVMRRLREREEPILLFGETDHDAFRRLRKLEILEPEVNRGQRNDFQEALERVDQAYLNEILKTVGGEGARNVALLGEAITMESVIEMARDLNISTTNTNELRSKVILKFVELMLQLWGSKHNARPEGEKMSVRGKMDSATYTQTQAYLKPLIKCLKKRSLPDDIMECLIEIVQHCLDRDYVKANDAYLQMAIGNAPWPIGVTMVGIHARTGREKIFSKHVAHVLNDETQRKYIQGLKRLMTKCQQYFSADPSKCVEYKALVQ